MLTVELAPYLEDEDEDGSCLFAVNKSSAAAEMGDRLATMNRKVGAAVPLSVVGELGPHLTQCCLGRGLPPRQVAWGNRPTVWPQHTNVTDRQTGQTTVP